MAKSRSTFIMYPDPYVLPSLVEGEPFYTLETATCKKSVIPTSLSGVPILLKDDANSMPVPPRNIDLFSSSIIDLGENPRLIRRMGNTKVRKIAEQYQLLCHKTISAG